MSLKLISGPEAEPVSLENVLVHSVIELVDLTDESKALIGDYIVAAREKVESASGLIFVEQVWDQHLRAFPSGEIEIQKAPLRSIELIEYVDTDGNVQVLAPEDYAVDDVSMPAVIAPAYGKRWPSCREGIGAVRIRFKCGLSAPDDEGFPLVPQMAKQAIRVWVVHMYENRELVSAQKLNAVPESAQSLINEFMVVAL